ncbi:helix-turn-helix domain-containing protein [Streptomyces sp. GbtcB7]|uniref:helix-turn-helix domain-containing protein n=1 Tax=Streptomyces sp. GbtcB7 TaxID=2824752 RepID=UPI001C2FF982|nr:helix-turn-helix domain-containing protein [Streptomyces sp. GbtcB7]
MIDSVTSRDTAPVRRLFRLPDTADDAFLHLGLHVQGSVSVTRGGTQVFLAPGDLVFHDPAQRDHLRFSGPCRLTVFRVPRGHLGVSPSDLHRVMGRRVRGDEGVGALVSNFLSALAAETDFRGSRTGHRLARSAVDLVAVLVMQLLGEETPDASDVGTETVSRIQAFIEEHLTDPDLSPESIALAHHISVRYLHKLFQQEGATVGQWIRRRRLDACRRELGRSANRRPSVAAVAQRWGFSSPSHFSRTFRDAYGMSPSEWQSSTR